MEKVKSIAIENKNNLLLLFLGGAILAGINTFFGRADYNIFIYLYMSYIWKFMQGSSENQSQEKSNTFNILIYSLFIDIFWCLYWNAKWNNLKVDPEGAIHSLVILTSWIGVLLKILIIVIYHFILTSWIGILLKIVIIFMIGILEWNTIKKVLPQKLQEKLNPDYAKQIDENNDV